MEEKREMITLADIQQYLWEDTRETFVAIPLGLIPLGIIIWFSVSLFSKVIATILVAGVIAGGIYFLILNVMDIIKLKRGTLFTITTDVLVRKEYHIRVSWYNIVDRLHFQYDRYDIYPKHRNYYDKRYRMELGSVIDTAFEGDTFTLIKIKNSVLFAYNNKLFDVQY